MRQAGDSRAHPRHAARVRRYSIRPLDITSSIPRPRASAQRRAYKVSGLPLSHAAAPPPFPPARTVARDTRTSAAPPPSKSEVQAGRADFDGSYPKKLVRIAPHAGAAPGGIPLAGEGGSLSVGPPAEVLPARSALPRDKRGARNSGQGRGSPVVGRAARLFRLLPAAGAAEERGESWESRQVVALVGARTCRLSEALPLSSHTPRVPTRERRMP